MEVLFVDLNMKALNSLIWASAVLAKLGVVIAILTLLFYAIMVVASMLD